MTAPGGSGGSRGQDINLAALWIPIMPETSHMGEEMEKSGKESKRRWEQGFNSGASPEAMGQSFGNRVQNSIAQGMSKFELPFGISGALDKFGGEVDQKLVGKLKGEATQALSAYRVEWDNLQQAQARATETQVRLTTAQQGGFNQAHIMLPLMSANTKAQNELTEANGKTGAAYTALEGKQRSLAGAMGEGATASKVLAGAMGGLVVAGAQALTGALESVVVGVIEGAVEAFKTGVEGAKMFAEKMIELGETYEHIGIQITEFSDTSGAAFEELESHAQAVFGRLDVEGKNVGQTMAQFAAMLDAEPGPALDRLTEHVTELQGRFTNLKAADLAQIFVAFNVPVEQSDSALASLLESARGAGQGIGDLTSQLSGNTAIVLQEAGLNLEQAGEFMAQLMRLGPPGRQAMTGMSMAMKEFGKEGLTFSDGMKLAGQKLNELGDTAEGQDLAEKLFGARNWAVAKVAVQEYLDVVEAGPDAFHASSASVDEFLERTRTLQNEWEIVKHKAQEAFLPMGEEAVTLAGAGLDHLATFVDQHADRIKGTVKGIGLFIIQAARDMQKFGEGILMFFAPIVDGVDMLVGGAIQSMATFAVTAGHILELIPGMHDTGKSLVDAGNAAYDMGDKLEHIKVGDKMRDLAKWSQDHPIDVGKASKSWVDFADDVDLSMTKANDAVTGKSENWFGSAASGTPGIGAPTGSALFGGGAGGPGGGGPSGGGPGFDIGSGASATTAGAPTANEALARNMFPWPESEWAAFNELEMHEAGYDATAKNPKSGAFGMGQFLGHEHDAYAAGYSTNPVVQLQTMFQYIKDRYGTPSAAWAQYYQHPKGEGYYATGGPVGGGFVTGDPHEAGYGPGDFDSPDEYLRWYLLQGQMQHISRMGYDTGGRVGGGFPTVVDAGGSGLDSEDFANTDQFLHAVHLAQIMGHVMGHQSGGLIGGFVAGHVNPVPKPPSHMESDAEEFCRVQGELNGPSGLPAFCDRFMAKGGPSGTDTVPAWLTPGEYVWDTDTVDKWGWLIGALHQGKGFGEGGKVDDVEGTNAQIHFADDIAKGFGLQLTAGKSGHGTHEVGTGWHDTGAAGDFSNSSGNSPEQLAFARYMFQHYGSELSELIYNDPGMPKLIKDGAVVDPSFYGADTLAGHRNHVHVAIQPTSAMTDMMPGADPIVGVDAFGGAGSTPGGSKGANFPGMPGQYGGHGVYGGETYDQVVNAQQATQDAKDRASDMDYTIGQQQKKIDDLKAEIANVYISDKTGVLTGQPLPLTADERRAADDKAKQLNDQLNDATHQLTVSQRERGQQDGKIAEAQRKEQEAGFKKPSASEAKQRPVTGEKQFEALGGGLLKGIGEELGLGDVFSKSPLDWGITKLATGLVNWGFGTANAWADEIGKGHTGVTGFQPIEGWDQSQSGGGGGMLSGVLSGAGISLPKMGGGQGSNVSSGPNLQPGQPAPFGAPTGPAPGPVVQGDYMPINVSPNVDPKAILGPVQEQRNSQNAHLHGQTGGLPQ